MNLNFCDTIETWILEYALKHNIDSIVRGMIIEMSCVFSNFIMY